VTDLSLMYQCGKCSRDFGTPDQLKNHEIPCRGRHTAENLESLLSNRATEDLTDHSPKRLLSASRPVPQRASGE
jgi:hypothetical protein